jgi:uncharacterized membrane protein
MVVFLGLIQGWILLQSLQALWDPQRLIGTLIGALIVLLSNVLPRVRANWWIGIRTPWTLSSDEVWRRTHLIGGQTGVITGLLIVMGTWMVPTRWTTELALAFIMAWALLTTVASYWYSTHPDPKGTES